MNRNTENKFTLSPTINIQRSKFDRSSGHKTTFNAGELIPIYVDEVLPGDTFSLDMASIIRMSTPIFPTMDNAYMDTYFFYVPNRIIWDDWKKFNGENMTGPWTQTIEYSVPMIQSNVLGTPGVDNNITYKKGTIADYMGIPTNVYLTAINDKDETLNEAGINALPFRAYTLIWNEFFRDQNLQTPAVVFTDSTNRFLSNDSYDDSINNPCLGGMPLPVNKYHDYFTSCLPEPQKGDDVMIPGIAAADVQPQLAPVYSLSKSGTSSEPYTVPNFSTPEVSRDGIHNIFDVTSGSSQNSQTLVQTSVSSINQGYNPGYIYSNNSATGSAITAGSSKFIPDNLWANIVNEIQAETTGTINDLRQAFAIQRLLERDARSGSRYTEMLHAHFGVTSPDARQQRPEYLGGERIPINIDQVLQTSESSANSPQGNTAAYSLTGFAGNGFTKSFTEHGFIIGLCCVRTDHTYQQGIERFWSRRDRFDYYYPALANIGEQPVYHSEIMTYDSSAALLNPVFGYQEAWADYRYKPSRVSGEMRSNYPQSLDVWHYADDYGEGPDNAPYLSDTWIRETKNNIARTLAVQDQDQFIADFAFKCICTRPMPIYSIPGLVDHY